ncbi:ABI family member 3 binding protein [Homo sapiens]|uniref:Target of Nesh-SH3 n=1 Tax=Homo sapiens TaxID=9606 RepID=TARSH_HUMAN|nr:target of Nesh-SH3 isoform 5 precursor [Homo sapiens]Q7Z7G0.2 RecName: Full=Target of Nesh-SH3; Short=Tarsh; AltName: Full=ABI gene family member 3-binding protein; AltName: Full=Nesh-binding protein; Short=NeshBP; Flags: Precursor [Homo sapiens]KAI2530678.1 ABI family member 3 binding protein [Homo sapiens]KAI4030745.1 ABI family member 3 binding protein [Homo sapiens]
MLSSLGCLLLCGSITLALGNAQKLPKGKRPNLKVHINTTSDSILLKFLRPSPNVKLEGLLLGYGSNVSPNQYFPLPAEGKFTEAIVDAEPKYLIVVRPAPPPSQKKSCSGKTRSRKPLQLVVGTLTPSSVFLSWGFLINPHHDWTLPSHCPNDRFYTIRYREKDKEKKWIFQICPATETIVENLKPNTVYEFGVKDNVEGGIWSKIFNHKTVVGSKKVNGKIQSTYDQDHTVPAYVPRKLIPITIIKQVIQNVTHKDSAKSPEKAPLGGVILVHLIIPGLNETTVKLPASLMFEISDALKTQLAKNETLALPAESKTPEVEKISARPTTVTPETVPRSTKPTTSSALDVSETTLASSEKPWIVPTAKISEDSKVLQPQTATYDVFSSPTTSDEPEISDSYTATSDRILDSIPPKTSRTLEQPRATLAPSETPFVPQKLEIFTSPEMQPTTPAPQQTTSIPSTPKRRPRPKPPRTKPERTTSAGTITPKISKSPEPTWTTPAPGKTQFISLKPKIPLSPEVTHTKPAPKQTPRAPPKPKTSPRPRIPQTQPVPKVPQRVTAKPKTSPSPEVSYTTPAPKDVLLPHKPYPEVSQSEPAPLETRGIPFIPMISPSPSQEELQTTLEETDQSTQEPFTTKIPRTTELAKTTQAPHRFYTTVRPRTSDKPHIRPGVKQAPRPSGADRNVSVDSTHPTKKPGTRRPPLPPRPTHPRRKPLPPNNVTGKPGSAGIISSGPITTPPLRSTPRPTGTPLERIETDIKQPTVPASGEELENITDFSSSPTRETDPLGKPRFKGPHVRYIQKPDNSPCSITDSVKRFPKEEATEGNATSPPQNPPTNLTVVTVEGCPSFVILDWEKPLNDTVTEYEVISRENGSFSGKNKSIQMTNQTFSTVENLKPNTSYEFQVKPKNPLGEGPVSNTVAFSTESADPRVSEPVSAGRDAIWTERPFNSDSYSECKGKQYVKRTWYKKFVGVQLCNSLRYKIYLSDSLTGKFYNIGDQRGHGEDHCQFVDSFLDGRTGQQLTSDQLPIKEGYFRAVRQEPVQFGEIGGHTQINYVQWYECGTTIPGKW